MEDEPGPSHSYGGKYAYAPPKQATSTRVSQERPAQNLCLTEAYDCEVCTVVIKEMSQLIMNYLLKKQPIPTWAQQYICYTCKREFRFFMQENEVKIIRKENDQISSMGPENASTCDNLDQSVSSQNSLSSNEEQLNRDNKNIEATYNSQPQRYKRSKRIFPHFDDVAQKEKQHSSEPKECKDTHHDEATSQQTSCSEESFHEYSSCGNDSASKILLEEQKKRESLQNPCRCNICGNVLLKKSFLRRHKKLHSRVRPYMSAIGGKSYIEMIQLKQHKKIYHPAMPTNEENVQDTLVESPATSTSSFTVE